MKKIQDFNFWYLVDATAFLAAILIVGSMITGNKNALLFGLIFGLLCIMFIALYFFYQDTKITNESETKAFIKAEQGDNIDELLPKSTKYGIDGVKINGVVYKTPDGTHAKITKENKIKIDSVFGWLVYAVRGGVMSDAPIDWKPLFDAK